MTRAKKKVKKLEITMEVSKVGRKVIDLPYTVVNQKEKEEAGKVVSK